jgi:hypothetical protein
MEGAVQMTGERQWPTLRLRRQTFAATVRVTVEGPSADVRAWVADWEARWAPIWRRPVQYREAGDGYFVAICTRTAETEGAKHR